MGEIAILHAADARAFSCRLSAELAAEGHSVLRRDQDSPRDQTRGNNVDPAIKADAVVVVWSPGLLKPGPENAATIEAARRALARRALAPVRIGGVEPPSSFAHLWPIDLDGWSGETDDPRWQFVRDEIALAMRRSEIALSTAQIARPPAIRKASPPLAAPLWRIARSRLADAPRLFAPGAFALAVVACVAVFVGAQRASSIAAQRPVEASAAPSAPAPAPVVAYIEPIRPAAPPIDEPASAEATIEVPPPPLRADSQGLERLYDQSTDDNATSAVRDLADATTPQADAFAEDTEIQPSFADENGEPVAPEAAVGGPDTSPQVETVQSRAAPAESPSEPAAPIAVETPPVAAFVETSTADQAPAAPEPPVDVYAGVVFRDCLDCPDMTSAAGVALSRREVTFDQWGACVRDKACRRAPDSGFGRGARPVINVSYDDARAYVDWLTKKTGWRYRLPTESEWGRAAQAEKAKISPLTVNYAGAPWNGPLPTGSFPASEYGLYDLRGNVWEWTADCAIKEGDACKARVLKGGAYDAPAEKLSLDARWQRGERARAPNIGFRIAREIS